MESDVAETFEFWFLLLEVFFIPRPSAELRRIVSFGIIYRIDCGEFSDKKLDSGCWNTE